MEGKYLSGGKLAGGNPENGRVDYDFYATNPQAVDMLMDVYELKGEKFLEPCVGQGHIAKTIKIRYPNFKFTCMDIVDRGYDDTKVGNFLTTPIDEKFDCIVSNPPYSLAMEFIDKCLHLLNEGGQVCMFLKIQFLEGAKRKEFFEQYPPKYVYVFRHRMATWNNGHEYDDKGNHWSTTMCHAWFVWEKGSKSEPIVRWL